MSPTTRNILSTTSTDEPRWFIAFTKSCMEKKAVEALSECGYECYLPIKKEVHQWSDRRKVVDRMVIPRIVFVHCTEKRRRQSLTDVPYIYAYMNDSGPFHPAVVRDSEMETFRMMVEGCRQVTVSSDLKPGDWVRVTDGPLRGRECELVSVGDDRFLVVRLAMLGAAGIRLEKDTVVKIDK